MGKSLISFRTLLKLLTKTFLLEANTTPFGSESVQKLIETQVKSFSALAKSLEEAQLEFPRSGVEKYEDCVKSLTTLAQYLNGLRSSCGLQYDMLKRDEQRKDDGRGSGGQRTLGARVSTYSLFVSLNADQDQSASADLIEFLDHIGKPMKSLALTCKLTIEHLQDIFTSTDPSRPAKLERFYSRTGIFGPQGQNGRESADIFSDSFHDLGTSRTHPASSRDPMKSNPTFEHMQFNLAKALDIFEAANSKALKRFYSHQNRRRSSILKRPAGMVKRMSEPSLADIAPEFPELASDFPGVISMEDVLAEKAPVGEQIFLVYFFVFNLMEFSKELSNLVNCVDSLVDGDEGLPFWIARNRRSWWKRIWFSLTGFPRRLRRPVETNVFDTFDGKEYVYGCCDILQLVKVANSNASLTCRGNLFRFRSWAVPWKQ